MNRLTWNLTQLLRETIGMKPMNCWQKGCQCQPADTFQCTCCDLVQPFCRGASDDYPDLCDNCWVVANQAHEAVGLPLGEE